MKKYISFFFSLLLLFAGCSTDRYYQTTDFALNTYISVSLPAADKETFDTMYDDIRKQVTHFESLLDAYTPGTDISRINAAAGVHAVTVDTMTFSLIEQAIELGDKTFGRFDISAFTVGKYWHFGDSGTIPAQTILDTARYINYKDIQLNPGKRTVFLPHPQMQIELGGIAKGFIVDHLVDYLHTKYSITHGIIDTGGDMFCLGNKFQTVPWRIGIQHPRKKNTIYSTLPVTNKAVATSGDYERYFIQNGQRYCHILVPETGYPAGFYQSVSVIADSALIADVLATAIFAGGPEYIDRIKKKFPEAQVHIIEKSL